MRKAVTIIVALAAGVWAFGAWADTWTDPATGYTWTYYSGSGSVYINAVSPSPSGVISIPDNLGGKQVTSIGSQAFYNCTNLTNVLIPEGVQSIDYGAFEGCKGLTSVLIPDSVMDVSGSAFHGCGDSLFDTTTIPGVRLVDGWVIDNTGHLSGNLDLTGVRGIAVSAFSGCSGLTSVTMPSGIKSVGHEAFKNCTGLTSITIPDGVGIIGLEAFMGCSGLTNVVLRPGLTRILDEAFRDCSNLMSVTIPDSVTLIGGWAFHDCNESLFDTSIVPGVKFVDGWAVDNTGSSAFRLDLSCARGIAVGAFSGLNAVICYNGKEYPAGYFNDLNTTYVNSAHANVVAHIREEDPTIIDIYYSVTSERPTVKVRALAFEDGVRSFAKVVRPETFVRDTNGNETSQNIGDNIETKVPHALSWKVSSDWATRLAKVKFEILVLNNDNLMWVGQARTIPASDRYGKMKISRGTIYDHQVFNALLWQYADKDPGLSLSNGVLRNGSTQLASGTSVSGANATQYVFTKMGFDGILSGARLNYVNQETRLGLSPSGVRQYAYKMLEE